MLNILSTILLVILFCLAVLFSVFNHQMVLLSFKPLNDGFYVPLYLVIFGSIFVGFLWGILVMFFANMKLRMQKHKISKKL